MSDEELQKRLDEISKEDIEAAKKFRPVPQGPEKEQAPIPEPVDVYQVNQKAMAMENKTPRPKGAPSVVGKVARDLVAGGLARSYKKARDDYELLKGQEELERAKLVKDQYMQERFLPAVESLVMFSSPDEVLNSKPALRLMDSYVLSDSGGDGYTASYIKSAYGNTLGNSRNLSDEAVREAVDKIMKYACAGNNVVARGIAKKIKAQIDAGEHIASDPDYEVISRVVVF